MSCLAGSASGKSTRTVELPTTTSTNWAVSQESSSPSLSPSTVTVQLKVAGVLGLFETSVAKTLNVYDPPLRPVYCLGLLHGAETTGVGPLSWHWNVLPGLVLEKPKVTLPVELLIGV